MTKEFEYYLHMFTVSEPKDNSITISGDNCSVIISVEKGWYKLTIPDSQIDNDRVIGMEKDFNDALNYSCLMLMKMSKYTQEEKIAFRYLKGFYEKPDAFLR